MEIVDVVGAFLPIIVVIGTLYLLFLLVKALRTYIKNKS